MLLPGFGMGVAWGVGERTVYEFQSILITTESEGREGKLGPLEGSGGRTQENVQPHSERLCRKLQIWRVNYSYKADLLQNI